MSEIRWKVWHVSDFLPDRHLGEVVAPDKRSAEQASRAAWQVPVRVQSLVAWEQEQEDARRVTYHKGRWSHPELVPRLTDETFNALAEREEQKLERRRLGLPPAKRDRTAEGVSKAAQLYAARKAARLALGTREQKRDRAREERARKQRRQEKMRKDRLAKLGITGPEEP
jgi:cobyrinic acid a,c-diamide synthase